MHKTIAQFILHTFWCNLMNIDTFWALRTRCRKFIFFLLKPDLFFSKCSEFIRMNFLYAQLSKKLFLLHLNRLKCIKMHQNVSKCIKMYAEWIILMFWAWNFNLKNFIFLVENCNFFSKCSKCINMHQNASKCMQNELCKCFVHEIIQNVILITSKGSKINEIHLPLYGGTPCIVVSTSLPFYSNSRHRISSAASARVYRIIKAIRTAKHLARSSQDTSNLQSGSRTITNCARPALRTRKNI